MEFVYVLAKGDVEYDRCPVAVDELRAAILSRTQLGQITEFNKGEWLVYALDQPSGKRRSLTLEERAGLFP